MIDVITQKGESSTASVKAKIMKLMWKFSPETSEREKRAILAEAQEWLDLLKIIVVAGDENELRELLKDKIAKWTELFPQKTGADEA